MKRMTLTLGTPSYLCKQYYAFFFSNVELYINNQHIYNSNGLYAHKSYIFSNFKGAISEYKCVLHCEKYDFEANHDDIQDSPLSDPFFSGRLKMLLRSDGFTLYGKLGVDFFKTYGLLYPNMKVRIRVFRAIPNFYLISDYHNVSLGIVDCSLYTHRLGLKEIYHKKKMDMLEYSPVEYNYMETLTKTFIIPYSHSQFIHEKIFNNAPIRRIAIALNTNSAFTGSFTENPFWYQQFDLRQIRIHRGGQPFVEYDTFDNCRLYVTWGRQCRLPLNIVIIQKRLENRWDWSLTLTPLWNMLLRSLY